MMAGRFDRINVIYPVAENLTNPLSLVKQTETLKKRFRT